MTNDIEVWLDSCLIPPKTAKIQFDSEMSLNKLRRQCSTEFSVDIVSLFKENGQVLTDPSDLTSPKRIIASQNFTLKNYLIKETISGSNSKDVSGISTICSESRGLAVNVEILSEPNSGKTSLIQSFIRESFQTNQNAVVEVTYKKKLDIELMIVDFSITDTQEIPGFVKETRFDEKEVILLLYSKEKLIEFVTGNNTNHFKVWLKSAVSISKAKSPTAVILLVITKYDIVCEQEQELNQLIQQLSKTIEVLKVSVMENSWNENVKNPYHLFDFIGRTIVQSILARRKKKSAILFQKSQMNEHFKSDRSLETWFGKIRNIFSCFSNSSR